MLRMKCILCSIFLWKLTPSLEKNQTSNKTFRECSNRVNLIITVLSVCPNIETNYASTTYVLINVRPYNMCPIQHLFYKLYTYCRCLTATTKKLYIFSCAKSAYAKPTRKF